RERAGVKEAAAEFGMFERPEVFTGFELRTFHDLLDRGDRRHQEPALDGEIQEFGLRMAAGEFRYDSLDPFELAERFGAAEELLAEGDPILVARGFVAETALAQVMHQLAREDAQRRPKQESEGDIAVARGPYQRDVERAEFHSSRHTPRLHGAERRRKNIRLRRHRHRLLRRHIDMLP